MYAVDILNKTFRELYKFVDPGGFKWALHEI